MFEETVLDIFGDRLRLALRDAGMLQKDLSAKTGITRSTLSSYATRHRAASIEYAALIAKELGCSLDWLCGLSDTKEANVID